MPNPNLSQCELSVEQAKCLPPICYTDANITGAEETELFRHGWVGIGRADQVAKNGDFTTLDFAGQTVILLRDQTGTLRAFANTCRHRAARLVEGAGNCRGLRCPFHSWFYGLDGRLVSAPGMEAATGFDKDENGLIAYRAEERHGFAFLCLDPNAPPIDEHLGDFADFHTPWPLETLKTARRRTTEVACNWKAFIEVFNEYYHLPFVHPDTVDSLYAPPDPADTVTGSFATQFGQTEGTGGLLEDTQEFALPQMPGLTGRAEHGARYTWVFPNMTFAANTDALWIYESYPLGPDRCHVVQTLCVPPETMASVGYDEKVAAYFDRLDAALAEDVPALENQQRGFACPDAVAGRFHPELEPNVAAFARWYASKMQGKFR